MKMLRYTLAALVLSSSVALAGCSGDPEPSPAVDDIAQEDVVDLGDLITQDPDLAAAAEMIGDPAALLAEGRRQGEKARGDVAAALGFVKDLGAGEPVRKGPRPDGGAFAVWEKQIQGKDARLAVVRLAPGRFRYLVAVDGADGKPLPLMTGIFVKKGPRTGGGRLHVNLSNLSDTFNAPGADGAIHFWFANHRGDKRGRRIAYRNVVRRDDPDMRTLNYAGDLVRVVGVGGRFRSVGIGDFIPALPGPEATGLRILWKRGEGGRGSATVASVGGMKQKLGTAHECWGMDGLRSAYEDDNPNNDAMNPNEGDVTMCAGFAREMPPDLGNVGESGSDNDPELDSLLQESGSMDIAEAEASSIEDAASDSMVRGCVVIRFVWALLVVAVAQVAVLPNALAFEESRTEYGARLRLTSLPARVRLDTPVPGFSDGGRAALLRAIATWNARACSSPLLVVTEDEDDVLIEIVPILEHWQFGSAIAAHTAVESDPFQGDIRHVVIEIDARRTWSQEVVVPPDAIDLESVFLHEIGHALGLDHSRNQDAVMRAGLKPGQPRRALHNDDVNGICAITKTTTIGENKSMSNVGLALWHSKWVFVMMLFFVVGAGVISRDIVRRTIRRYSMRATR